MSKKLVHGYIREFEKENKLFHNFEPALIKLCVLYCINQLTMSDFEQMGAIGSGEFGYICKCKKKDTGKLYAIKLFNKYMLMKHQVDNYDGNAVAALSNHPISVMHERNILSELDSKFVTVLKYAFMDEIECYLVLDLINGGNLKYHLEQDDSFTPQRTKFYAAEILLGLEHIHSKGIIFRDLKLENILLDNYGHCKISSFRLAIKTDSKVKGNVGRVGYKSPQCLLGMCYDKITDYFSLGVLIYRCLSGLKPFSHSNSGDSARDRMTMNRRVVEFAPGYDQKYFDGNARSLLKGLLHKNAKERLGAQGVIEIKQHPWFDSINFNNLANSIVIAPFIPNINEVEENRTVNEIMLKLDTNFMQLFPDDLTIPPVFDKRLIDFDYPQNPKFYTPWELFDVGDLVTIFGLTNAAQFNEQIAQIVGPFMIDTKRWPVQTIENTVQLAIKTENLQLYKFPVDDIYEIYKIVFIMSSWIRLLSVRNNSQSDENYYNIFDFHNEFEFIELIQSFVGEYLTFYDEIFKIDKTYNYIEYDLKGIEYKNDSHTFTLYIDGNQCNYLHTNEELIANGVNELFGKGIWNIEGNALVLKFQSTTVEIELHTFDTYKIFEHIFE
eukprot:461263_1